LEHLRQAVNVKESSDHRRLTFVNKTVKGRADTFSVCHTLEQKI
jgi:hypothetical protein